MTCPLRLGKLRSSRILLPEQGRLLDGVRDDDHRQPALGLQVHRQSLQALARRGIQRGKWLIHEQDVRVERQRAGDRGALALAAGQLAGEAVGYGEEPEPV